MKIPELAKQGITRVRLVKDGKSVWNEYSFADLHVFEDGTTGPWIKVYDPCGQLACENPAWKPMSILIFEAKEDEFEPYSPPADMGRFPGCPPVPDVISLKPPPSS